MDEMEETFHTLQKMNITDPLLTHQYTEATNETNKHLEELLIFRFQQTMAELQSVESAPLNKIPESDEVKFEMLTSDIEKDITELEETQVFVSGQNNEIKSAITREEEYGQQHSCVSEVLDKRLDDIEKETDGLNVSLEKHKEDICSKTNKTEKYFTVLVKILGKFVDKHFPLPTEAAFNEVKKKLRSADRMMTHSSMISLKTILEELMNKCFDQPSDPYVVIDHRYWPPYVELLLRCQIALRHPDDEQRIKLVPFHL